MGGEVGYEASHVVLGLLELERVYRPSRGYAIPRNRKLAQLINDDVGLVVVATQVFQGPVWRELILSNRSGYLLVI